MSVRTRTAVVDITSAASVAAAYVCLLLVTGGVWANVAGSDLHGAFIPRYEAVTHAVVREHRLPLWNPWELCGTPLHGTAQGGALYLPILLAFSSFPSWAAVQALFGFHAFVLALGSIVYLRRHDVGRPAAMLAAAVTLGAACTGAGTAGFDHPNLLGSLAWVPFLLLAWEHAVVDGARPWLAVLGLVSATQWCVSYPDFPMDMPILLGLVALVSPLGTLPRRVLLLAGGLALGAALAAVQILPLAEAVGESVRDGSSASFDTLRRLLDVPLLGIVPKLGTRIGYAALALATIGVLGATRGTAGWLLAALWASFALKPPFIWLYEIPPWAGSRLPVAWGFLAPLFISYLAAAGLHAGLRFRTRAARGTVTALALVAAASAASVVVRVPSALSERAAAVADTPDYHALARRAEQIEAALREGGGPRFVAGVELRMGTPLRHHLHAAGGYDPTMPPRRIARLLEEAGIGTVGRPRWWEMNQKPHLLDRLGIGTLVMPAKFAPRAVELGFARVATLSDGEVVLAKYGLPRARVAHTVVHAATEEEAFARVVDRRMQPGTTVVLERPSVPAAEPAAAGSTEGIRIDRDDPEHIEVTVELATNGLLVLTDTWAPGWDAAVDGAATDVLLADYAFRAVAVPAGRHRVTLRYRPPSLLAGGAITAAAALVTLLILGSGVLPRRRSVHEA